MTAGLPDGGLDRMRRAMARHAACGAIPGRFGWEGGYGTSWHVDPTEGMNGVLLTQRLFDSSQPPTALFDVWTTAYAAIDDRVSAVDADVDPDGRRSSWYRDGGCGPGGVARRPAPWIGGRRSSAHRVEVEPEPTREEQRACEWRPTPTSPSTA